ncbi:YqeB family protein [Salinicoccus halodurans]|uniref:50S ribosomal protein L29 n=1 Tax=Salinicoccus halodurans TaxID=407035 RepID=A0A0F7HIN5_9STAP|nr:hypothetical protein [Salinicoccus halodurans]AKG72861.1 hypothetical protein AAT16_00660 [Salinicoccus halodurans]SFK75249.1 hypothetical protein SAMN05216235_1499 [Salinicoccus halodurans]
MSNEKLGLNTIEKTLVVAIPIILSIVSYFLPSLLLLIQEIPFLSDNQLVNFITGLESAWIRWVLAGIGFIAGILLSLYIYTEILKIEVYRDYILIDIFDKKTKILKSDIESIFKEKKKLVIIDINGLEFLRENTDYSPGRLKDVFQKYHYPWVKNDPHSGEFFEWSTDHTDLNERANDILYNRRQAMRADEEKTVKNLRQDLMEIGIVVKDKGDRQYVRITDRQ